MPSQKELYCLVKETRDMLHELKEKQLPLMSIELEHVRGQVTYTNGKVKMNEKLIWATGSGLILMLGFFVAHIGG